MLKIAKDASWLLTWRGRSPGNKIIRERYHNLLLERGYAYYNGRIRITKLIKAVSEFYSLQFLADMHCQINNRNTCWLVQLLHPHKAAAVQHPLHHLLLMTFLGVTAENFFTSFKEFKPFGEGPWPCLNRASKHFRGSLIKKCRITDNIVKRKSGRPLGIFECSCGFIYNRVGPDSSFEDRLHIDSVQTYGQVWESLLRECWSNTTLTVQAIADLLGISHLTVTRHAIRLKLPMNTPDSRDVSKKTIRRYNKSRKTRPDALQSYRSKWLSLRKQNSKASRQQLMDKANSLYLWLRKNDSDWLENNLPAVRKVPPPANRLDWVSNDCKLSSLIKEAASFIKELPDRPVRVSLAAIIRKIGFRGWIENYRNKLPRTDKAINEYVESPEDFSIRRVKWAMNAYLQKGICPTRLQLMVFAGVRTKAGRSHQVQNVIDDAIERLR